MNSDNEQHLIDRIQILLLDFEGRIEKRFSLMETRMGDGFHTVNTRLDSIDRRLTSRDICALAITGGIQVFKEGVY